jgi:hypothetical protein
VAFGKKHKQIEDEAPVETPEPTPPPAEEKAPEPVQYAPGEGSMQHPF